MKDLIRNNRPAFFGFLSGLITLLVYYPPLVILSMTPLMYLVGFWYGIFIGYSLKLEIKKILLLVFLSELTYLVFLTMFGTWAGELLILRRIIGAGLTAIMFLLVIRICSNIRFNYKDQLIALGLGIISTALLIPLKTLAYLSNTDELLFGWATLGWCAFLWQFLISIIINNKMKKLATTIAKNS